MKKFVALLLCLLMVGTCVMSVSAAKKFTDVSAKAYYAEAVTWAVTNGVTSGMTDTTFAPNATCTRAQAVTFIWRANGSPEPTGTKNPFSDVKPSHYFYKAVLWAVEKGITSGMTPTTFGPNLNCTRAQIVTFLWNSEGKVKMSAKNPFTDVKAKHYFYDAVLWAVKNEITAGMTKDTFAPSNDCTRAQIVTFLMRHFDKKTEETPDTDKPSTDKPSTDKPSTDKPDEVAPLTIKTQPVDYQMTSSMEDATFTVEIEGGQPNYYYNWFILKDNDEFKVTNGAKTVTSDTLSYSFSDYDFDDYRDILVYCVITDAKGNSIETEHVTVLSKESYVAPLTVKTQPVDYQMTSSMENATFTVEIEGGKAKYNYNWFILKDNDEFKVTNGAKTVTSDTLTYSFSDYDFDDYRDILVYCVITDMEGNTVETDHVTVLSKESYVAPLTVKTQPVDYQMTSSMENATFTVEIEGGKAEYNYNWFIFKDNDEFKVTNGAKTVTSDTLTYSFSDYDFDDYRDISVFCIITDAKGNSIETEHVTVLPKQ